MHIFAHGLFGHDFNGWWLSPLKGLKKPKSHAAERAAPAITMDAGRGLKHLQMHGANTRRLKAKRIQKILNAWHRGMHVTTETP